MEPRLSLLTLGVSDLEKSKQFYEALGLFTTWTIDKGVIFFKTNGTILALYPLHELLKDIGWDENHKSQKGKFGGVTIAHNTREKSEVDVIMDKVSASGGTVIKKPQDAFWGGYSGYFADPDGHVWELAWGAFPIKDDGSLDVP